MSILTIRKASKTEVLEILSEERISSKLANKPRDIIKDKTNNFALVIWSGYRLLVTYKKTDAMTADCHLACPAKSLPAARVLALIGMNWLVTDTNLDVDRLTTSTLKGSMSNFAKKIGFVLYSEDEVYDYFIYSIHTN